MLERNDTCYRGNCAVITGQTTQIGKTRMTEKNRREMSWARVLLLLDFVIRLWQVQQWKQATRYCLHSARVHNIKGDAPVITGTRKNKLRPQSFVMVNLYSKEHCHIPLLIAWAIQMPPTCTAASYEHSRWTGLVQMISANCNYY